MTNRRLILASAVLLVAPALLLAQPPETGAEPERDFTRWEWTADVRLPEPAPKGYLALLVPPGIFSKAQEDLNDLRLADAKGARIPFALRILRTQQQDTPVNIVRTFDAGPNPTHHYYQVNLELGAVGPPGYNDIDVETTGTNFHRKVEAFGDRTDKFDDPRPLLTEENGKPRYLVRYETGPVDVHRFRFDFKQYPFMQVRVYADRSTGEEIPKITKVTIRRTIAVPGTFVTRPANLEPRQNVRGEGGPGSAWFIDLGERVPVERLSFNVTGPEADRPYRVQIADADQPRQDVGGTDWHWQRDGDRRVLEIGFPEVFARRLRLVITDFANEPLNLSDVHYTSCARQVIFELPAEVPLARPLRLFVGNPSARPPRYDFAQRLPPLLTPPPTEVPVGDVARNPTYQPPPEPLAQREPWLIYVILGSACVVLLGILALLARGALARHDVQAAAP